MLNRVADLAKLRLSILSGFSNDAGLSGRYQRINLWAVRACL
jgi:hypothetical protein